MLPQNKEMQARELTPTEIEEGRRGIVDSQLTATEVQALVRKMDASKTKWKSLRQQNNAAYVSRVQKENELLYFNYPSLFDMHINDRLDGTFFEMLNLKRKIERGEITAEQASTIVGQQLFSRYIPQAIDSNAAPAPPKMSYEEFYRRNQE